MESGINKNTNKIMKKIIKSVIVIFIFCLSLNFVDANFVCGEVKDSQDNVSAYWYDVMIYYPINRSRFTSCQVSPAGNKYCCDAEAIPGKEWKAGDIVHAEIFDSESGYVSGPVSIKTSAEAYDVLPIMKLEKVIDLRNLSRLIISNSSKYFINASFKIPYNNIDIESNEGVKNLCINCTSIFYELNSSFGMNHYTLIAKSQNRKIKQEISFGIIQNPVFKRESICQKCKDNKVKSRSLFNMSISINISDYIEGMILEEYVPRDFEILDSNGGEVREYSLTHNVIVWNISGRVIRKEYALRAPAMALLSEDYIFKSELEKNNLSEDKVQVKGLLPFIRKKDFKTIEIKKSIRSKIYPGKPFVLKQSNDNVITLAVFPNIKMDNAEFNIKKDVFENKTEKIIDYYSFDTNIGTENIEKIYIEFKIKKNNANQYKSIEIISDRQRTIAEQYKNDSKYSYYKAYINSSTGFAIAGLDNKGMLSYFLDYLK
ncbi:MAG: hypothetical protein ACP5OG_05860 [Candidatus Nanoarchaeia archaeon]